METKNFRLPFITRKICSFVTTISLIILFANNLNAAPTFSYKQIDELNDTATLDFSLEPTDGIFYDSIDISIDHPQMLVSSWQSSVEPMQQYEPEFKESKKVLKNSFKINIGIIKKTRNEDEKYLHISYYQKKFKKIVEHTFALPLIQKSGVASAESKTGATAETKTSKEKTEKANPIPIKKQSWTDYFSDLFKTTDSIWLRIILSLILGLLLSLTPCIYPMIPITIGILQSQARPSTLYNLGIATSYTLGIATTFSLLGLLAAFTGQIFGNIMGNPFVIIGIVALLLYLAGSMIGLYEMYMPKMLQQNNSVKGGSFVSAFLFGAASGTIASPCLSPGLVLLLTIVTTLQSKLLGFLLLFSFGIGLSLPLLLIGTFSSSIQVLPNAGTWMVDIKQLIGFMMIGICFYFLNTLLPVKTTLWLFGLFVLSTGVFYLYRTDTLAHSLKRKLKRGTGTILTACSVLIFAKAYQAGLQQESMQPNVWLANYGLGLEQAKKENKKILLDVSAPYCSICKAIDKKVFANQEVQQAIVASAVPIKIEELDTGDEMHCNLQKQFNIMGVPTLLLIDPQSGKELQRWGSELYDQDEREFIAELQKY